MNREPSDVELIMLTILVAPLLYFVIWMAFLL
jgi:hypothetical protein